MKKLILTAILASGLPAFLATAEDKNDNGNPPDVKPRHHQGCKGPGGKCAGKGNKPMKKDKPDDDRGAKNQ